MVEEADLTVGTHEEGQGQDATPHAEADEAVAGVVRATVRIGGALTVGPVTPRLQHVAAAIGTTVRVGRADVRRRDAPPDGLVADLAPGAAVRVGTALRAGLEKGETIRACRRTVGVRLAPYAGAIPTADLPDRAVAVVCAGHARPGGGVAGRGVAVALRGVHAVDAPIADDVAALTGAIRVHPAARAGVGGHVAHTGCAVGVDDAADARVAFAVTGLPGGAVAVLETAVTGLIEAAAPTVRAIDVLETLGAAMVGNDAAPAVRTVGIFEAGNAAGLGVAAQSVRAVGVVDARGAATLRNAAPAVRTMGVVGTLDAGAGPAADPAHRAVGVRRALHAHRVDAPAALSAVFIDGTSDAAMVFVAGRDPATVDIGAARDARFGLTDPCGAVRVVEARHADPAGRVAAAVGAIGVIEAADALGRRGIAAAFDAVAVDAARDARVRRRIADPAAAVLVEGAVDAHTARRVANPPPETVAVPGAGDAGIGRRVADFVLRTLLPAPTLDAEMRAREADAALAILVAEAGHALVGGPIASSVRALRVVGALDATTAREVAHADGAVLGGDAVDADPACRVAVTGLTALRVLDALPAEPAQLGTAPGRGRAGVVLGRACGGAARPHRIANLTGRASDGRAGLPRSAEAVRGHAVAVDALETDLARLIAGTGPRAEASVREFDAGGAGAGAFVVEFAARAGGLAEGSAVAGLRIAVLVLGAGPGHPAVGLEGDAHPLGDFASLTERAVVLSATPAGRQNAAPGARIAGAEYAVRVDGAFPRRGVPLRPDRRVGGVLGDVGAPGGRQCAERNPRGHGKPPADALERSSVSEKQAGLLRPIRKDRPPVAQGTAREAHALPCRRGGGVRPRRLVPCSPAS